MKLYTNTNKILSTVLASTMTLSLLATTVNAADFTDINEVPWAIPYITDAVDLGLVSGYDNNTFRAAQNMKVGEFLVMMTNTYPELKAYSKEPQADYYVDYWGTQYVYAANKAGLFPATMDPKTSYNDEITREQAAYFVYKAMTTLGGESNGNKTFPTGNIKDYSSIRDGFRESVTQLYMFGIMAGTDTDAYGFSTFTPQKELTRAELCVIMLALNEPDRRKPASTEALGNYSQVQYGPNGEQIIQAGESYERPMAQEGDIVVKEDGTQVVLKIDPETGVLGWGQGVAADLGLISPIGTVVENNKGLYWPGATDSLGNSTSNQNYWVNALTGEGHWTCEIIAYDNTAPKTVSSPGELSDDLNWVGGGSGNWISCFTTDVTWEKVAELQAMN